MKTPIEFAVIQAGYCVFGAGNTYHEALEDAAQWLEDGDGKQGGLTPEQVDETLVNIHNHVYGDIVMMESDHPYFDSYLENQGGFSKIDGKWYADK